MDYQYAKTKIGRGTSESGIPFGGHLRRRAMHRKQHIGSDVIRWHTSQTNRDDTVCLPTSVFSLWFGMKHSRPGSGITLPVVVRP